MQKIWESLPIATIPIDVIEFRWHGMSRDHVGRQSSKDKPVNLLWHDDRYLVADGRHRVLTDFLEGASYVQARVLDV